MSLRELELGVSNVLQAPAADCKRLLPKVFEKWLDPAVSQFFVMDWISGLRTRFIESNGHIALGGLPRGYTEIAGCCVEAGILPACLGVVKLDIGIVRSACIYSLEIIDELVLMGTNEQKLDFGKLAYNAGLLDVCYWALTAPGFTRQAAAADCLGSLSTRCFLTDHFSTNDVANFIVNISAHTLRMPDHLSSELSDPKKKFQKDIIMEDPIARFEWQTHPCRWYSSSQDRVICATLAVFCTKRRWTCQECFQILSSDPNIIDLLLDIALTPRVIYRPDANWDCVALMTLAHLLMIPWRTAPWGLDNLIPSGGKLEKSTAAEQMASRESFSIFWQRPLAYPKLWGVWSKVSNEDYSSIQLNINHITQLQPEVVGNATKMFASAVQNRGYLRICILKMFSDLTYINPEIPPETFLPVLTMAYEACMRIPTEEEAAAKASKSSVRKERSVDFYRLPKHWGEISRYLANSWFIARETLLGPTLFLRILNRLVRSGHTLSQISRWKELPPNAGLAELVHIKQVASLGIIAKIMRSSVKKRIPEQKAAANELFQSGGDCIDYARCKYISAAELAMAVLAFDVVIGGKPDWETEVGSLWLEVVKILGNASAAFFKLCNWREALWFAEEAIGVVQAAKNDTVEGDRDPWGILLKKNRQRAEEARVRLNAVCPPN